MKKNVFYLIVGATFLSLSAVLYLNHYLVFDDSHHLFIFLAGDLAFLPLEALFLVLIIERVLARREKKTQQEKLNMVIGSFFSETGNYLLNSLLPYFTNREELVRQLNVTNQWKAADFQIAAKYAEKLEISIDAENIDLQALREYLSSKRYFILALFSTPNLLEHDRFTSLLWAITHVDEELEARKTLTNLPASDIHHLFGDVTRLYNNLVREWLDYTAHLKVQFPYLFSLVVRTHPFQENPAPTVTG